GVARLRADHAGFGDQRFLYSTPLLPLVTFGSLIAATPRSLATFIPGCWTTDSASAVEDHLVACPCGGRFLSRPSRGARRAGRRCARRSRRQATTSFSGSTWTATAT